MILTTNRNSIGAVVLLVLGFLGSAVAQKPVSIDEMKRLKADAKRTEALSDGTFKLLWSKMNIELRNVVKGAPYSAIAVSEHTQTLIDGNQIIKKSASRYYRDSEGRVRTERRLDNIGTWTAAGEPPQVIMIADSVAGRSYTFDPNNRTARIDAYQVAAGPKSFDKPGRIVNDPARLKMLADKLARKKEAINLDPDLDSNAKRVRTSQESSDQRIKKESLGTQTIEGVTVEGTRATQTIPAGEIGNTLPIQIIDESWYSPDLQLRVMTKHTDPRSGESTFRLTNIDRSEPSPSLFEVPPGYTVIENQEKKSEGSDTNLKPLKPKPTRMNFSDGR